MRNRICIFLTAYLEMSVFLLNTLLSEVLNFIKSRQNYKASMGGALSSESIHKYNHINVFYYIQP